jgi:hypothetical protein
VIQRVAAGEQARCHALADDHHGRSVLSIALVEIATSEQWHAERRKEAGRNDAKPAARIFFTAPADVTVGRELETGSKRAALAPGRERSQRNIIDARYF